MKSREDMLEHVKIEVYRCIWAVRAAVALESSAEHIEQLWGKLRKSVEEEHRVMVELDSSTDDLAKGYPA